MAGTPVTISPDRTAIQAPAEAAGSDSARACILEIQDAFRKGDYARIAARYHDDVDWLFHGPSAVFPEISRRHGKIAVFQALAALNVRYRFERYVTNLLTAEGDRAAAISDVTMVQRANGRIIRCRIASFYRVSNGLVVEYRGFTDSFDAAEQVLGRELQL